MARTLSNVRTKISQSISLARGGHDTPPRTAASPATHPASVCPEPPPSTASRRLSLTSVPGPGGGGGRTAAGGYLPDLYREGSPEKNWIDSLRSLDSGVAATTGGGKQQVTSLIFLILQHF